MNLFLDLQVRGDQVDKFTVRLDLRSQSNWRGQNQLVITF